MNTKTFTTDELTVIILPDHRHTLNTWLNRGDGVAIYRNLNHGTDGVGYGEYQFISYGSRASILETATPPTYLPDIAGMFNAGYRLEGVYHGQPLGE